MEAIITSTNNADQDHYFQLQLNFDDKRFNFLLIALGAFICVDVTLLLTLIG